MVKEEEPEDWPQPDCDLAVEDDDDFNWIRWKRICFSD
jgi:hypothetical protein